MIKWTKNTIPGILKIPYLGQLTMPFLEEKFANKWYNYALPKGTDKTPFSSVAVNGIKDGACFCLSSLTQGLIKEKKKDLKTDGSIPITLIYGDKDFTHKNTKFNSLLSYSPNIEFIKFGNCGHFPELENRIKFRDILIEKL